MNSINRNLGLSLARVTEIAAIDCGKWMGRGDKNAADQAAVNGMRRMFDTIDIDGTVVIGEGEKDEAPMLYIGERIGKASDQAPQIDIAVDPLDGTTSIAKGLANAVAIIAVAPKGTIYHTDVYYMEKMAVGPAARGAIDLNQPLEDNIRRVAEALGKRLEDVTITIQDRERHSRFIERCRALGCRIRLFVDGDVCAAISTCIPESGTDMMLGIGGAPEGVLTAAAMKCMGGEIQGRLFPLTGEERLKAKPEDFDRVLTMDDLISTDEVIFVATGVTDGDLLKGVRYLPGDIVKTHSVVMRGETGTLRYIEAIHNMKKKDAYMDVYAPPGE